MFYACCFVPAGSSLTPAQLMILCCWVGLSSDRSGGAYIHVVIVELDCHQICSGPADIVIVGLDCHRIGLSQGIKSTCFTGRPHAPHQSLFGDERHGMHHPACTHDECVLRTRGP